jgi:dolichyl-diphosphooligosaccharide--protein glycosyltransferase
MKKNQIIIALTILLLIFLFTLWIRVLPLLNLGSTDILNIVGSDDPMFSLRQVDQMLANYPAYAWYEAMSLFPSGQVVPWGPLFTWITTTVVMISGAATRNEIISVALWIPPLMAAVMVPAMFILVRKLAGWKAGLCAAALVAVVGGQYFFRALAGYLDHHIAEVLFSTLFCIAYIYALAYFREHTIDFKNKETWKVPLLLSALAGIGYFLGYLTMPTMILFAAIVAVSTVVISVVDFYHGKPGEYLVFLNTVAFGIAAVLSLVVSLLSGGFSEGFGFYLYTLAHPIAYLLIIIGTWVLYWLAQFAKGKSRVIYPASIIGLGFIAFLGLFLIVPDLYGSFVGSIEVFFGFNPYAKTVQEARPWTLGEAWQVFNFGILLMIGGILVLLYENVKKYRAEHIFVLVWSLFIIIAAFRQIRYEYYIAVNIAVLGGICVSYFLERAWTDIVGLGRRAVVRETKGEPPATPADEKGKEADKESVKETVSGSGKKKTGKEKGKGKEARKEPVKEPANEPGKKKTGKASTKGPARPKVNYANLLVTAIICAFAVIFAFTSVGVQYAVASSGAIRMNQDWRESLEWMNTSTPDTRVDYFTIYDKESFKYPDTAYGVMSWWDYGHLITYIAKRIPNANPFQAGVYGPNGSAAFFMSQSETETNRIADNQGTRYVMTDIEMAIGKFWAMATWHNASVGQGPYQPVYLVPTDPANPRSFQPVTMYTDEYFLTTVSRLHNFDGSYTPAGEAYYIEYTTSQGTSYPIITNAQVMEASQAHAAADQYNAHPPAGYRAAVVSAVIVQPTTTLSAFQHYRLVHESPSNVFGGQAPVDLKYVKVFEYVPGARIRGEGMIELPLVTNTGRQFTWRAESVNGEFIVPYSTEGNPYDVRAAGKYRIAGTGREVTVSEAAVMGGAVVP